MRDRVCEEVRIVLGGVATFPYRSELFPLQWKFALSSLSGYVLYSPLSSGTTYLLDTEGRPVHTWESDYAPHSLYLLPNGNLLRPGRDPEARRMARQEKSRPIADAFAPWLTAKLALISQKTKLAEAIRYALSRWDGLTRFLDDGTIEIDSNTVERSIRPIALNRKNALFAGSDRGGETWAIIASLIETCKLNGIDPQTYLADVLTKIVNGHPHALIDDLLPWAYTTAVNLKAVA